MAGKPDEDSRNRAREDSLRFVADVLVEMSSPEDLAADLPGRLTPAFAQAVRLQASNTTRPPKCFSSSLHVRYVEEIDKLAAGKHLGSGHEQEPVARLLYGNVFSLCMALKPRPRDAVTADDPNYCPETMQRFFSALPQSELHASLDDLGKVLDHLLEQECTEIWSTPAKLRSVLLMLAHPALADPETETFEVFKKLLRLVAQIHAHESARAMLVKWLSMFSVFPLAILAGAVAEVHQVVTITLVEAQEAGPAGSLEAVNTMNKGGALARLTRNALRLLSIYWDANEVRREKAHDWQTRRRAQLQRQQGVSPEELGVLPTSNFFNDALNDCEGILKHDLNEALELHHRGQTFAMLAERRRRDFGIIEFPFVLTPVCKVRLLNIESLVLQRHEVQTAMVCQVFLGSPMSNPFLVLKVRRNAVIEDALNQLAKIGPKSQHAFKKPLKVVFDGEEGVDEGGVQKEFFQLLIEELYNEDFGMFEKVDETRSFWFNKNSFESKLQFELFGIVLGLAIYNQVILDAKFPMAVYKKLLMGPDARLGLSDLLDFQPTLAKGLISMLEYDDRSTFEQVFGLSFVVQYDCFGCPVEVELKEGGRDIPVTFDNRQEYVDKYCDWIFNGSVDDQYGAFRKGFDQCIRDTLFRQLFRPDELEIVICGSLDLDFHALAKAAQYQDGYSQDSTAIRWFWEVIHSLTEEDKRRFLQFCTGCDRAPVGGLGRLPLIVSRAGPDSNMLPWVHTCFNHLLLPEYSSKEKTDRLLRLAIQHCHGFGLM